MSLRSVSSFIRKHPFGSIFLAYVGIAWLAFAGALLWTLIDLTIRHQLAGAACFFIFMTIVPASMLIILAVGFTAVTLLLFPIEFFSERRSDRRWKMLRDRALTMLMFGTLIAVSLGHRAISENCFALTKIDQDAEINDQQLRE